MDKETIASIRGNRGQGTFVSGDVAPGQIRPTNVQTNNEDDPIGGGDNVPVNENEATEEE